MKRKNDITKPPADHPASKSPSPGPSPGRTAGILSLPPHVLADICCHGDRKALCGLHIALMGYNSALANSVMSLSLDTVLKKTTAGRFKTALEKLKVFRDAVEKKLAFQENVDEITAGQDPNAAAGGGRDGFIAEPVPEVVCREDVSAIELVLASAFPHGAAHVPKNYQAWERTGLLSISGAEGRSRVLFVVSTSDQCVCPDCWCAGMFDTAISASIVSVDDGAKAATVAGTAAGAAAGGDNGNSNNPIVVTQHCLLSYTEPNGEADLLGDPCLRIIDMVPGDLACSSVAAALGILPAQMAVVLQSINILAGSKPWSAFRQAGRRGRGKPIDLPARYGGSPRGLTSSALKLLNDKLTAAGPVGTTSLGSLAATVRDWQLDEYMFSHVPGYMSCIFKRWQSQMWDEPPGAY